MRGRRGQRQRSLPNHSIHPPEGRHQRGQRPQRQAVVAQRRDRFISPQFHWLQACLDQALRPTDARTFRVLVDAANRITGDVLDPAILVAEAEAVGLAYFEHWGRTVSSSDSQLARKLGEFASALAYSRAAWRKAVKEAVPLLVESARGGEGVVSDADDDKAAWDVCVKEIRTEKGGELDLDELIQGLALRSKEPPRDPSAVALMTVHAFKGSRIRHRVCGRSRGVRDAVLAKRTEGRRIT